MTFYLTFRQINAKIDELRRRTGEAPTLAAAVQELYLHRRYVEHASNLGLISVLAHEDDEKFLESFQDLYIEWGSRVVELMVTNPQMSRADVEKSVGTSQPADVFLSYVFPGIRRDSRPNEHAFEVNYVYAGTYRFIYEEKEYLLQPGDLCIVSPSANHMICEAGRESAGRPAGEAASAAKTPMREDGPGERCFLIQQFMNRETFHSSFIALLSGENVLSNFFKDILTNPKRSNFLLLSSGSSPNFSYIQRLAKDIFLEQFKYDEYAPECSSNLLKVLFANVLRSHHDSFQFYSGRTDIDFVPVLHYLSQNYRTTSLGEVARVFHYSESHLSTCIRQITGKTYTEMIRNLKMNDAIDYLLHTEKPVEEISLIVGYRTPDTFSRAFRQTYGVSPSQYRKERREMEGKK